MLSDYFHPSKMSGSIKIDSDPHLFNMAFDELFFVDYITHSKNLRNELLNRREVNTSQNTGKVKRYRPGMVYLVVLISK